MKLVKEHINEKFVEHSDPIRDLGIGAFKEYVDIFTRQLEKEFKVFSADVNYQLLDINTSLRTIEITTWVFSQIGIRDLKLALRKIERKNKDIFKVIQWPTYEQQHGTGKNKTAIIKIL